MVDRHSELSLALDVIARRVGVPSLSFEDVKASLRTNAEPSAGDRDSEETSSSDSEDAIRCNDSPAPQSKSTGIPTRPRSSLTSKDVLEIFALRPKMSSGRMARGSMIECKTIAPRYGVTAKTVREIWRGITWTETTMPHWTEHEVRMHVNGASRRRCTDDDQTETASHSPVEGNKSPANCHGVPVQGLGQGFGQPSSAYPVSMGGQHHLNLLAIQSALALGMPASTACFSPVVGSMPLFTPMTLGGGLGTNDLAANLAGGPNFAGGLGTNNFAANLSAALQASQLYQHATSVAIASAGAGAARVIT